MIFSDRKIKLIWLFPLISVSIEATSARNRYDLVDCFLTSDWTVAKNPWFSLVASAVQSSLRKDKEVGRSLSCKVTTYILISIINSSLTDIVVGFCFHLLLSTHRHSFLLFLIPFFLFKKKNCHSNQVLSDDTVTGTELSTGFLEPFEMKRSYLKVEVDIFGYFYHGLPYL